jgi:uncharacterized membrane protein
MYPRARLDALTDGIFAVAMTLLVLDLRLPDNFHPRDVEELLRGFRALIPNFIPWVSGVQVRTKAESFSRGYFNWWLLYMLLVTCVPFTTIVAGRFAELAPAIWLYAGNTVLIGIASFALLHHTPEIEKDMFLRDRLVSLAILTGSSSLAIAWSFVSPRQALLTLALNMLSPFVSRWIEPKRVQ